MREPIPKLTFKICFLVLVFGDPYLVFLLNYLFISLDGKVNRVFLVLCLVVSDTTC